MISMADPDAAITATADCGGRKKRFAAAFLDDEETELKKYTVSRNR